MSAWESTSCAAQTIHKYGRSYIHTLAFRVYYVFVFLSSSAVLECLMERGAITDTQTQEQTPANTLNCENCLFITYSSLPCCRVCVYTCKVHTIHVMMYTAPVIMTWLSVYVCMSYTHTVKELIQTSLEDIIGK